MQGVVKQLVIVIIKLKSRGFAVWYRDRLQGSAKGGGFKACERQLKSMLTWRGKDPNDLRHHRTFGLSSLRRRTEDTSVMPSEPKLHKLTSKKKYPILAALA